MNFRPVLGTNKVFRSGDSNGLGGIPLVQLIKENKIKTVLDLRGPNEGKPYQVDGKVDIDLTGYLKRAIFKSLQWIVLL
jgi:hypothetical protein